MHGTGQGSAEGTTIAASSEVPQLLMATDAAGTVKLMGIHKPGEAATDLTAPKTALALTATMPAVAAAYLDDPTGVEGLITGLPEYQPLVDWIAANFQRDYISDPTTVQLLANLVSAVVVKLPQGPPPDQRSRAVYCNPASSQSGVQVGTAWQNQSTTGIGVHNVAARWVGAFLEETSPTPLPAPRSTLVPATKFTISLTSFSLFDATSGVVDMPSSCTQAKVRVYGPGFRMDGLEAMTAEDYARSAFPWLMTVADTQALAAMEIVLGVKGLRSGGPSSKTFKTFLQAMEAAVRENLRGVVEGRLDFAEFASSVSLDIFKGLLANQAEMLKTVLKDIALGLAQEVAITLASYYVPVVGQLWLAVKIGAAASTALAAQLSLPLCRPKEVFSILITPAAGRSTLTLELGGGVTMELILIPEGTFTMGSPEKEPGREWSEGPQHSVTISQAFYIGKFEVTQAQYQVIIGGNPSYFAGDLNRPVEQVSWNDAQTFCQQMSTVTGRTVRLPTEAEWEYACRAGTTTAFYTGSFGGVDPDRNLDRAGWYGSNSTGTTHPVGQKTANAWGLYDMHGNVLEFCEDDFHSDYTGAPADSSAWVGSPREGSPVIRGGSWIVEHATDCRSAERGAYNSWIGRDYRTKVVGFRVVVASSAP